MSSVVLSDFDAVAVDVIAVDAVAVDAVAVGDVGAVAEDDVDLGILLWVPTTGVDAVAGVLLQWLLLH